MNKLFVKRIIGKGHIKFQPIAEGQQIGKRGDNKIVAEGFNALGQLIISIRDKYWRKTGEGAFKNSKSGVEIEQ